MAKNDGLNPDQKKLRKLLKGFRVAMLTTQTPEGGLRSRPMATVRMGGDGDIWFLTKSRASKVGEVEENHRINLSYASPKDERYVSLSGTASVVRDPQRVLDLWRPRHRRWFPEGKRDPDLAAMRVHVEHAEYWDEPTGQMIEFSRTLKPAGEPSEDEPGAGARIADAVKSMVTGNDDEEAEKPPTPGGAQG